MSRTTHHNQEIRFEMYLNFTSVFPNFSPSSLIFFSNDMSPLKSFKGRTNETFLLRCMFECDDSFCSSSDKRFLTASTAFTVALLKFFSVRKIINNVTSKINSLREFVFIAVVATAVM